MERMDSKKSFCYIAMREDERVSNIVGWRLL